MPAAVPPRDVRPLSRARVAIDATPLFGRRTGIGQYVAHLIPALAASGSVGELRLTAFSVRGRPDDAAATATAHSSTTVRWAPRRLPARLLQRCWTRVDAPAVEWLTGPVDLFHGTNFVLPPVRRARGVLTIHDLAYEDLPDTVSAASLTYRTLVPRGLRRAAVVCAVSEATAQAIVERYGFPRERIVVTPLGVDESWFTARPAEPEWLRAHGLPERYLLFVGTVEPRKNLPFLLDAYAAARAADPSLPALVLAGATGWGDAQDHVARAGTGVVPAGFVDYADLRRLVAGAAALVQPSRYEGFGLPPLEAFACGVPVVATDLPVVREVVGTQATLVPLGDVDVLAAALSSVAYDDGGVAAREARRAHAAAYTWQRCAERTLEAYRLALD